MVWLRIELGLLGLLGATAAWSKRLLRRYGIAAEGQSMVEYGIIIAVIAVVAMVAIQKFGNGIGAVFDRLLQRIQSIG